MKSNNAEKLDRAIVIAKKTSHYRIVTDNPDDWHIVANRPIAQGELVLPAGTSFHVDVCGVDFVDVVLEETQEHKKVYSAISAVPSDASCAQKALEIPWCFMNHSCEPNTHDRWNTKAPAGLEFAETEATRDIAEGEELTFDYDLEHHVYGSPFECRCGAESCRGMIRGFNGKSREQQERLLDLASPFVQEKYRRESVPECVDMQPHGRHLVVDYWDCDAGFLNDEAKLIRLLTRAANAAGATVISTHSHRFDHQGVTAVAILSESHISIHTWPEIRYVGVDLHTCGGCDPLLAHQVLVEALSAGRTEFVELARGRADSPQPDKNNVPNSNIGRAETSKRTVGNDFIIGLCRQVAEHGCAGIHAQSAHVAIAKNKVADPRMITSEVQREPVGIVVPFRITNQRVSWPDDAGIDGQVVCIIGRTVPATSVRHA